MSLINVRFEGKGEVIRALALVRDAIERQSVLQMIAEEAVALIKLRTLRGLDENDGALKPSRRAVRDGGQTLSDKGHMLGAMRVLSVSPNKAVIGFGSAIESKKAWWAQGGTRPHTITAGPGKVMPFFTSGTAMPRYVKVGRGRAKKLSRLRAGETGRGFGFAKSVRHPGTPKRPFFGISPRDSSVLQEIAGDYIAAAIARAEAQ